MSSPQKTTSLGHSATMGRVQPIKLLVTAGPDEGLVVGVPEGTAIIGTHESCALKLSDPSVSRQHAAVELLGARVRVKDLASKNGTRYLGNRFDSIELPLGASVALGQTSLSVLPAVGSSRLSEHEELEGLVGRSVAMRRLFAQVEQVAPTDAPVLIHGPTGSGKEGVARAIHARSPRASGPFIVFDCGLASPELMQASLFGHVKGAFTGAVKDSVGALELADGGVLFLDEVAELPLELQPLLLRSLERHTFQRVGEGQPRESDFRVLAATQRDLWKRAQSGTFRLDLYYRLAALILEVPPLGDRLEDIPLLAHRFAAQAGAERPLDASTLAALSHPWDGNVRELKNAVERVLTMGPEVLFGSTTKALGSLDFHASRERALKQFERSYLAALLERHAGNASAAAREAGIARSYLYKLLDAHGLKR